jgi:hypothetical protein
MFLAASFLGVAGVAHADSLGTNIIGFPAGTCTGSTVGTLNCTSSGSFGTASAGATGSVAAGTLGTSATFNIQAPSNGQEGASILSEADLDYTFALPTSPNGESVLFSLTVSGTNTLTPCTVCNNFDVVTQLQLLNTSNQFVGIGSGSDLFNLPSGTTDLQVSSLIGNGQADLNLFLTSFAECFVGEGGTCAGSTDFYDPLTITGAQVFDASGNLVSDVTLTSESGFNPNAGSLVPTPEPSSLLLMGTGLLALFGAAKRKLFTA